ncbi:protein NOI4-like isoform X1 [Rhododendron vialii]|uniref:protein NOI4-like isoform X1 n=1 Tax=Rhododendron vialii TaxID=182163 RepID=UPI00265E7C4D|nr:protein NOI4-like isoform X1 [Rhododendron vialii]
MPGECRCLGLGQSLLGQEFQVKAAQFTAMELDSCMLLEKGNPLPKFGEWDVNDPASAEGFTVIFNKARDEKKTGGKPESPARANPQVSYGVEPVKPQAKGWFCCMQAPRAES